MMLHNANPFLVSLLTILLLLFPAITAATVVRFQTTLGVIDIQLYDAEAPLTVQNFLSYVESDAYNHSFFHRSVPDFVV
jgi:peptidyl-prolyl cis-trans isomerase A (cyclophilin A)